MAIDTTNPASWPTVMRLDEVAAVFRLSPDTIRNKAIRGDFRPAPLKGKPLRWRRSDVLREVEPTPLPAWARRSA
jgi:predicted DNA-binding transcriptional regulator AlpA